MMYMMMRYKLEILFLYSPITLIALPLSGGEVRPRVHEQPYLR